MSDPADLISASVEAQVKDRIELRAYSTLGRLVGSLRQEMHEELYASIDAALSDSQRGVLDAILDPQPFPADFPQTKVRQFAAEAAALESGDLRDVCQPGRRYTLLRCLLHQTQSETRDQQLVEMFIRRRRRRTKNKAVERLHALQANQREIEETLLGVFGQVMQHAGAD